MFKKIILTLGILALLTTQSLALTLTWDANPATDNVTGYTVYWSSEDGSEGPFNKSVDGDTTTLTLPDSYFARGTKYVFHATAHNNNAESGNSDEVENTIPVHEVPADVLPSILHEEPTAPSTFTNV